MNGNAQIDLTRQTNNIEIELQSERTNSSPMMRLKTASIKKEHSELALSKGLKTKSKSKHLAVGEKYFVVNITPSVASSRRESHIQEQHDKIFDNQATISEQNLKLWAAQSGVDVGDFNECLDSGRMASVVQAEMQEGQQSGIQGTPGFLINGKLVSGAQPFSVFQQAIEEALAS